MGYQNHGLSKQLIWCIIYHAFPHCRLLSDRPIRLMVPRANGYQNIKEEWNIKMTAQKLKERKYHSQSKRHQRRHELTNLKIHEDYWQRCGFRKLAFSLTVFQSSFLLFVTVSYGASGKMFVWHETVILSVTSKFLANVKFLTALNDLRLVNGNIKPTN